MISDNDKIIKRHRRVSLPRYSRLSNTRFFLTINIPPRNLHCEVVSEGSRRDFIPAAGDAWRDVPCKISQVIEIEFARMRADTCTYTCTYTYRERYLDISTPPIWSLSRPPTQETAIQRRHIAPRGGGSPLFLSFRERHAIFLLRVHSTSADRIAIWRTRHWTR